MTASTAAGITNGRPSSSDSLVVFSLRVRALEDRREDILRSFCSLIGPATAEKSCVACRVFQEADNPNAISFIQAWTTRQELQRHVRSHQYRQLLSVVDLSRTAPEIRLDEVAAIDAGIGVLAAMAADHQRIGTKFLKGV